MLDILLAPKFAWTRLPFAPPRSKMCLPALSLPTKEIALMRGSSQMKLTASTPPCMMLSTPFGRPARSHSSAMIAEAPGSRSLGFRIKVLPVAIAIGIVQSGIIAGLGRHPMRLAPMKAWNGAHKLKGQIAAPTPSGASLVSVSMSFETSSFCPMSIFGMPHALSTTCNPPGRGE